ncbi:hypothetical protein BXZ70DRAFT_952712 [Cristinia sonorae]|uniref:Uncharacterized protein n=1 Tax=Cristinia sonorae TaxID=1940300 RepID=A0A8K0UH25_9AGAR|nr:hypothetical protein BXZ70DRAFT_952712 [Cristinia sonorae]
MNFAYLRAGYCPPGSTTLHPEELYNRIIAYQTQNDSTGEITIPAPDATGSTTANGTFWSPSVEDPMFPKPFDVVISDLKVSGRGGPAQFGGYPRPENDWQGPILRGKLGLEGGGHCGIISAAGKIEMRPLWRKEDPGNEGEVMELFEGEFSFRTKFNSLYSKKGFGRGESVKLAFWAVRSLA